MNLEKLMLFARLKGEIESHREIEGIPGVWLMRIKFNKKVITFNYLNNIDGLTFCAGRISTTNSKLGTTSSDINSFDHLMELL